MKPETGADTVPERTVYSGCCTRSLAVTITVSADDVTGYKFVEFANHRATSAPSAVGVSVGW